MENKGKFPGWWDWTSLVAEQGEEFAAAVRSLTLKDMVGLSRDGFRVTVYETAQEFFLAEALEYIRAWQQATSDNPVGVCGPIGPVEQLPMVARIINDLGINASNGVFAGMDEFVEDGKAIPVDHKLSFAGADRSLCFDRIRQDLRMPDANLFFPTEDVGADSRYVKAWNDAGIKWALTQGGQGNAKHFAFNDPLEQKGLYADRPPTVEEYAALTTRVVDLCPATIIQDARHSNGGEESQIPSQAVTVGPKEVLGRSECISIWHPGHHDNAFGVRLTTYMIANEIVDARVPMSLLARHHNVRFNFLGPCIPNAGVDVH